MQYDQTNIPKVYQKARQLSSDTLALWLDAITESVTVPDDATIIDVGCGTARFSVPLATRFRVRVIGVEPSRAMLSEALSASVHPRVFLCQGSAENLPIRSRSVDLIFLSNVFHHLGNPDQAASEFARIARRGAFLCVRNYTSEELDHVPYLQFFPAARRLSHEMLPNREALCSCLARSGFYLVAHRVIQQRAADTSADYLKKVQARAYSDLALISDSEFAAGLAQMTQAISSQSSLSLYEPVDLLVFCAQSKQVA